MTNFQICSLTAPCQNVSCHSLVRTKRWSIIHDPGKQHYTLLPDWSANNAKSCHISPEIEVAVWDFSISQLDFWAWVFFFFLLLYPTERTDGIVYRFCHYLKNPPSYRMQGLKRYTFSAKMQAWYLWEYVLEIISCEQTEHGLWRRDSVSGVIAQAGLPVI